MLGIHGTSFAGHFLPESRKALKVISRGGVLWWGSPASKPPGSVSCHASSLPSRQTFLAPASPPSIPSLLFIVRPGTSRLSCANASRGLPRPKADNLLRFHYTRGDASFRPLLLALPLSPPPPPPGPHHHPLLPSAPDPLPQPLLLESANPSFLPSADLSPSLGPSSCASDAT